MDGDVLTRLRDAVDAALATDLSCLDGSSLATFVVGLEAQKRRLTALDHRVIAAMTERGLAGDYAATSPAQLLVQLLRVTPAEAAQRVGQARDCGPRRELTGAPLPPILPLTAAAVEVGEISTGHVAVISRMLDRIPDDIVAEATPVVEQFLVDAARAEHPQHLARTAELLLARLDPDGREPIDAELQRRRALTLTPFADGSAAVRGRLAPQTAEAVRTVLDALSAPRPALDGCRDPRTAGQRRHDALHDLALHALRSGDITATRTADTAPPYGGSGENGRADSGDRADRGDSGGSGDAGSADGHLAIDPARTSAEPGDAAGTSAERGDAAGTSAEPDDAAGTDLKAEPLAAARPTVGEPAVERPPDSAHRAGSRGIPITVLATVTLAELCAGSGVVTTGHGQVWSVQQLLTMAADMAVAPIVLDHRGAVLAFGRTRRLASAGQRLALAARDRGCIFPDCDRPAAWCEAHHVVEWADGGSTDLDNLCLLCSFHHAHFEAAGWQVIMKDGLPHCVPPRWIDATRTAVRNTAHDLPEIDFRAPPSGVVP